MSDLRAARLTGVLFVIATVANLLGAAVRPGLNGTDYLGRLSAEPDRVAVGSLLLLVAAFAWKRDVDVRVTGHTWTRQISIEQYVVGKGFKK